jgi:hypothetical protein
MTLPSYLTSRISLLGVSTFHFRILKGYQNEILKFTSQMHRAWSDCMDVQAVVDWLYTGVAG